MPKYLFLRLLAAALALALPGGAQEVHLNEAGSGVILARSAFAHGYRHGYEEGYHQGNVDINMGRIPRFQQKAQFHGLKLKVGYSPSFGSKRSFEDGFDAGLKAGYIDGYAGQTFRAVDSLRVAAAAMASSAPPEDPRSVYFDLGLASGYREGWRQGGQSLLGSEPPDIHRVTCAPFHPEKEQDLPAESSYCEGYRRGYVLGQTDVVALRRDTGFLEASK
jgi:hypothetical protein